MMRAYIYERVLPFPFVLDVVRTRAEKMEREYIVPKGKCEREKKRKKKFVFTRNVDIGWCGIRWVCRGEVQCVRGSGFWKSVHEYIAAVSQYTKRINLHRRPLTRSRYNSLSLFHCVSGFERVRFSLSLPLTLFVYPLKDYLRRRRGDASGPQTSLYIHRSSCIYGCRDCSFVKYKIIITSSYIIFYGYYS